MTDKTADGSANSVLLTKLADEFAARYRAGQRPSLRSTSTVTPTWRTRFVSCSRPWSRSSRSRTTTSNPPSPRLLRRLRVPAARRFSHPP